MMADRRKYSDEEFISDKRIRFKTGEMIGTYKVVQLLSSDNLCQTYEVLSTVTDKSFVLKLLPSSLSSDKSFVDHFTQEAEKSFQYIHTNIANVMKLEYYGDNFFFMEELIRSPRDITKTLEDELNERKYTEAEIQELALQLCSALDAALDYKHGCLVHFDLKPSNILFDTDYNPKIKNLHLVQLVGENYFTDYLNHCIKSLSEQDLKAVHKSFEDDLNNNLVSMSGITNLDNTGNVLLIDSNTSSMMDVGKAKFIGAPYLKKIVASHRNEKSDVIEKIKRTIHALDSQDHMSPEQKSGEELQIESNIYSIGYILYRLLTGKKVCGSWGVPSSFNRHKDWDPIITKCLKRDPDLRYHSYAELIKDINLVGHKKIPLKALSIFIGVIMFIMIAVTVKNCIMPAETFDFKAAVRQAKLELIAERELIEQTEAVREKKEIRHVSSDSKMILLKIQPTGSFATVVHESKIIREFPNIPEEGILISLPEGEYTIYAGHMGYKGTSRKVELTRSNTPVSMELKPYEVTQEKEKVEGAETQKPKRGKEWIISEYAIEMVNIEPGQFKMGAPATIAAPTGFEMPLHNVKITTHYWIGKYEITQSIYEQLMNVNPSFHNQVSSSCPVENVSWDKAVEFCRRLTRHQKLRNKIPAGYEYRLPTEAEWEYACLANSENFTTLENKISIHNYAWFNINSNGKVQPTGLKEPNSWGIYDMHGNAWEWVLDTNYKQTYKSSINPYYNYNTKLRVLRGGSWASPRSFIYSYSRNIKGRKTKDPTIGFRIVLAPEQKY